MKKILILTSVVAFSLSTSAFAQVNTDSLDIVSKISKYQLQLGKLQNTVNQKTYNKQNDSLLAQQSAAKNSVAANTLSSDPENKKDARQADNAASDAKSNARKARKAADRLEDVQKNILDLQNKIAKEQLKMNKYTQVAYTPVMVTPPIQPDSTRQP
jgi:hypothetical protein